MRIIIASNNKGKIEEIKSIVNTNLDILSLEEVGFFEDIEEYGHTFHINALIKAQVIAKKFPEDIILADDSGICVDALDGAPGVYSARYASEEEDYNKADFKANNRLLLKNMENISNRAAYFITVLCAIKPGNEPVFFRGELQGEIAHDLAGENGFGYDPLFIYNGRYLADYTKEEKNEISHRKSALKKLNDSKLLS